MKSVNKSQLQFGLHHNVTDLHINSEMQQNKRFLSVIFLLFSLAIEAQPRGMTAVENMPASTISTYRWWNLLHYSIDITPDYHQKFISGTNSIQFIALEAGDTMRIDLQRPMSIKTISWQNVLLKFLHTDDYYLVIFPVKIKKGETTSINIAFEGNPTTAVKPPWDSGWIWDADEKGRPWVSIACEGSGASIWLPCKQVLYDEPDSGVEFRITVPDTLVAVANGRLQKRIQNIDHTATYDWRVVNPINNYNIIPYIGKYVTWHEDYPGLKGNLDCDYWVLDYNLKKAKQHLKAVDTMLRCFEYWMGSYPFYEDSYKLVEAPMAGMEHQSAIAYGNKFEDGYSGKNLSGTEWGLKWDFILVHESGHEWFGNSITANQDGESWIHEGFTKYLETLYTSYVFGNEPGNEYSLGIWKRIQNDEPILGSGSSDAYNKGSAMLHMIRQILGDSAFRLLLQRFCSKFYHSTVSTQQILQLANESSKHNFTKMFEQYLETTKVPVLTYEFKDSDIQYRWINCVAGFDMPVKISLNGHSQYIYPTTRWKSLSVHERPTELIVDKNFYIQSRTSNKQRATSN